MAENERPKFVAIVDDRLVKSMGRDVFSFATLLAAVGIGVLIGSDALQWVAGIMWVFLMFAKSAAITKTRYTIAEARGLLDKMEADE